MSRQVSNRAGLTEQQIRAANSQTKSCAAAARYLGVSYNTYRKYARMYGMFEEQKNVPGKGIPKLHTNRKSPYGLDDIIDGKHPHYPPHKIKKRLIRAGYKEEVCENCGYSERRMGDDKVPLVLTFKDGDSTNHMYDNMKFLCFNCAFQLEGDEVFKGSSKNLLY